MNRKLTTLLLVVSALYSTGVFAQDTGDRKKVQDSIPKKAEQIQEVVVTALGIKKEVKKLGYAMTEIKGEDVSKVRAANPVDALAGKVAGLSVGASTEMLGRPEIVLRGSKDLLYVVDGVPINSDTWNLSPDDIESYSILKGPNAAALYGFRGINGAIIITTKRGTKNRKGWVADYNGTMMFDTGFVALPESQYEYGRGTGYKYSYGDRLYDTHQRLPEWGPRFEGQPIQQYDSPWNPVTQKRGTTPWLARGKKNFENFVQTGMTTTHNISLAASGDKYNMRFSYTHLYQEGMFPNTRLNGDNLNLNASYNINDRLNVEGNLNLSLQYSPNIPEVSYGPNSYVYMFKVYGSSDYDVNDLKDIWKGPQGVDGLIQYAQEYGRLNSPWFMAKEWLRTHNKTDIYGYIKATYKFNQDLSMSIRSQISTWNQIRTEKVPPSTNLNDYVPWWRFGWYGDYRVDERKLLENNTDILLNFNKKLGEWSVSALAGANMRLFKYDSFWGTTRGLTVPKVYTLSNTETQQSPFSWDSEMQVYSAYYSVDIGYKKYFNINTTGRVDNSSALHPKHNVFFYPSASISTVISDYVKLGNVLSYLKFRASFAYVKGGNTLSTIPSAYTMINRSTGQTLRSFLGYGSELNTAYDGPEYGNQDKYGITSYYNNTSAAVYTNTLSNEELRPFTRASYEVGIDMKFFKNRIGLEGTYFRTVNGPQIFREPLAASTGMASKYVNALITLNQGFEIALNAAVFKNPKGFSWNMTANWSTYRETLKEMSDHSNEYITDRHTYKIGERMDAFYGTKFIRDRNGNIVHNYDQTKKTGDGLIYSGGSTVERTGFLGYLNPDFSIGITNTFSYKNWSLSFQWDARVGGKMYDFVYMQGLNGGTALETITGAFGDARLKEWNSVKSSSNGTITPGYIGQGVVITKGIPKIVNGEIVNMDELEFAPNTNAVGVRTYLNSLSASGNAEEYGMVSRSFVKLRQAGLTYNFPKEVLERTGIRSLSLSLVGRNLLYFAKRKDMDMDSFPSGYDAQTRSSSTGSGVLQSPSVRAVGINLNIGF